MTRRSPFRYLKISLESPVNPFWKYHNGIDGFEDWEDRFKTSARSFAQSLQAGDSARVLSFVFDRFYSCAISLFTGGDLEQWCQPGAGSGQR